MTNWARNRLRGGVYWVAHSAMKRRVENSDRGSLLRRRIVVDLQMRVMDELVLVRDVVEEAAWP